MVALRDAATSARAGFTLAETLIALVLSSFIIGLVSHTFLVQNQYYSTQTLRSGAQDNVRVATELMAREIRTAMEDGVIVAGARTLTLRSPVTMTIVCSRIGAPQLDVFNEGGESQIDTAEVAGIAARDPSTGAWEIATTTWDNVNGSASASAGNCADGGADTVGVAADFHRLRRLDLLLASVPDEGDVVMLFRETTFKIQTSQLDTTTLGLFRGVYGGSLVEFATGIDTTAHFEYRTGGSTYADTISSGTLTDIDAIRLVAQARKAAPTGGQDDIRFGWSVNVALRSKR